ncbi:MAG: glycoside hydrolase family 3 protein [Rhizobiales bacterium]|nr:glycoside hydrolase family 3 protein [Hyphomicrobiales bacterium]
MPKPPRRHVRIGLPVVLTLAAIVLSAPLPVRAEKSEFLPPRTAAALSDPATNAPVYENRMGPVAPPVRKPAAPPARTVARITPAPVTTPAVPTPTPLATPDTSLSKAVASMIMVGFRGRTENAPGVRRLASAIADGKVGGVILMGHNIAPSDELAALTARLHAAAGDGTLLIAVDQEGGEVQRLAPAAGYRRYPSAAAVAARTKPEDAETVYARLARGLASHGINFNLGPVVDLARNRRNPIIAARRRSYGAAPDRVTAYAAAFVRAHRSAGVATSLKHFPGHGSSWTDSHEQLVDLTDSWHEEELEPYRALIAAGLVDSVMIGHLYHPEFATEGRQPASLSARAIEGRLRQDLGFSGVVITDDLEMAAIRRSRTLDESVLAAIEAGADIVLASNGSTNDPRLGERLHALIMRALASGRLSAARIEASARRIARLKERLAARALAAAR